MKRPLVITLLVLALGIVCLGIGSVIFFTANGGFPTNNPFDKRNISSQLEETKTLKVDAKKPLKLAVATDSGAVTVTGADVSTVQVKVVKTAYDSTQTRADKEVKDIQYTIEQDGNSITLKYALPQSMNFSNRVNSVDFIVTVPHQTTVDVDNNMGDVSITDIEGNVVTQTDFGEISVNHIKGATSLTSNSGTITATSITANSGNIEMKSDFGALTLEKANGNALTLETNNGSIKLNEVRATGKLTTSTEFGDVTIENGSADSIHIDTNSGGISLTKLTVKKDIYVEDEFGSIDLDQALASSYDLSTNSGDITIDDVKGKVVANTEFGSIEIANAESVTLNLRTNSGAVTFDGTLGTGPHMIKSEFGAVDLTLPDDIKLNVDLSTEFGSIKSDLPISVTVTESANSDRDQIVGSINGGGDQLTVETNNGGVNIHVSK